ncbi:MAG: aminoacyl--tRNA ligase-related protein [Kiritimatiellia bacterium]
MLDLRFIRENPDFIRQRLERRGWDGQPVSTVLTLDRERRRLVTQLDALRHKRNELVRMLSRDQQPPMAQGPTVEISKLARRIRILRRKLKKAELALEQHLRSLPNLPHPSVPEGCDPTSDRIVKQEGDLPQFQFATRTYDQLGEKLGIMEFARAVELAGRGNVYFLGEGSRLVRALVDFMLTLHSTAHGYIEVRPPLICTEQAAWHTAHLPAMASGMYSLTSHGLWLVPDGEVPLLQLVAHRTIEIPLPFRLMAWSMCFRHVGRHAHGLLRMNQFESVELLKCVEPATEMGELEMLLQDVADVLRQLEIPYRIVELSAGNLSFAAQKAFRVEVWAPGQKLWLAVSTCRSYGAFLARRAGVRYKDKDGKTRFVHIMSGAGVALPHLMVALLENGQTASGTVRLPKALWSFMKGTRELVCLRGE